MVRLERESSEPSALDVCGGLGDDVRPGCSLNGSVVRVAELGRPGTGSDELDISDAAEDVTSVSGKESGELDGANVSDAAGKDVVSGRPLDGRLGEFATVGELN